MQLLSISSTGIDVLDPEQGHLTLPTNKCLALVRPEPLLNVIGEPHIKLKDGQVFIGRPTPSGVQDVVLVNHPWLGELHISLARIDSIQLNPTQTEPIAYPEGFDQITLNNGDALAGFISSINDPISIEVERNGTIELLQIPWDRVSQIRIFGEPEPNTFPRVWLQDGTIVSINQLVIDDGWWLKFNHHQYHVPPTSHEAIKPTTSQNSPSISNIHSIVFNDQSIRALSQTTEPTTTTPRVRITDPGPTPLDTSAILGLSPLNVSGPTVMTWDIPEGVDTFRMTVRLPTSMWAWGNLDIQLLVNGNEYGSAHIDKESPEAYFITPVSAGELTIQLLEGSNGPIQDTVILEYPMFFNRNHPPNDDA